MAYSPTTYVGNDVQTDFTFSWPYLDQDHVKVYLGGALQNTTFHYSFPSSGMIRFFTPPGAGVEVLIKRETPGTPVVTWSAGSTILPSNLNTVVNQAFYIAEEAAVRAAEALSIGSSGHWDGENKRITNVASPVNDKDVATKLWVNTSSASTLASAIAYADQAAQSAINASQSESAALGYRVAAEAASDAAANSAAAAAAASTHMAWTWNYDTNTAAANPGTNEMRFNNATRMSATEWYVHETAKEGSVAAVMDFWGDSSSSVKATVTIRSTNNINDWFMFHIMDAGVDNGVWRTFTIQPVASNGTFSNGEEVRVMVVVSGDAGTGAVNSWNGRTGAVVPATNDYTATQVQNTSTQPGASVKDALDGMPTTASPSFTGNVDVTNSGANATNIQVEAGNTLQPASITWKNVHRAFRAGMALEGGGAHGAQSIGTSNEWVLQHSTDDFTTFTEFLRVDINGRLGIGTNAPAQLLHVEANGGVAGALLRSISDTAAHGLLMFDAARGTVGAEGYLILNDLIQELRCRAWNGSTYTNAARLFMYAGSNHSPTNLRAKFRLQLAPEGSTALSSVLEIDDQRISINGITPVETLDIRRTVGRDNFVKVQGASTNLFLGIPDGGNAKIATDSAQPLVLQTNNADAITIDGTQDVTVHQDLVVNGNLTVLGSGSGDSWQHVADLTPSGAATIDITGLDFSTYQYMFVLDLTCSTTATLQLRGSTDGGATWKNTTADYEAKAGDGYSALAQLALATTSSPGGYLGVTGQLHLSGSGSRTGVTGLLNAYSTTLVDSMARGKHLFNGIRLFPSAGTVSGKVRIFRIVK